MIQNLINLLKLNKIQLKLSKISKLFNKNINYYNNKQLAKEIKL